MTRFKSVLCASLLTLAISSSAFAGEITGKSSKVISTSITSSISVKKPGEITGISTSISSPAGNITDQSELVSDLLRTMFGVMGMLF
jgi:hypothetical protein